MYHVLAYTGARTGTAHLYHRQTSFRRLSQASMDSPLVTQLFRQLFSHRASQCLVRGARPALAPTRPLNIQRRGKANRTARVGEGETRRESRWQPRNMAFPNERAEEFDRYPLVTADMLRSRRERPRRVKMLLRDFIEGAHPN